MHLRAGGQRAQAFADDKIAEIRDQSKMQVRNAEVFAVETVMSEVVKMAAEELPEDAVFLTEDLPTATGMLFLSEPFALPPNEAKPGSQPAPARTSSHRGSR